MQAHAEETFTLALLPALLQYRPAARPLRCKGDAAAGRAGRDGAWPASQGPGTKGGCRGQGHGGRHQKPSATTRWGLLHSDTLAVLSLGESEGSGDNGPGGVVDGSAMGFQEEQDGCQRMRHWWQHSQLLEVGPHVAGNVSRSERGQHSPAQQQLHMIIVIWQGRGLASGPRGTELGTRGQQQPQPGEALLKAVGVMSQCGIGMKHSWPAQEPLVSPARAGEGCRPTWGACDGIPCPQLQGRLLSSGTVLSEELQGPGTMASHQELAVAAQQESPCSTRL